MTRKYLRQTAEEYLTEKQKDTVFLARAEERDRKIAERQAASRKEQAPLLADLRDVGIAVNNVWDLVNTCEKYTEALPVLIKHLPHPYSVRIREGIARALTVREAKCYWHTMLEEFLKEEDKTSFGSKWAIANAMSVLLDDELAVHLYDVVQDERHGESRNILIEGFGKLKREEVGNLLRRLLDDPLVVKSAEKALKRFDKRQLKKVKRKP